MEGYHMTILALESPLSLAMMALLSALVWSLLWRRTRAPYMLLSVAGWVVLCLYFSLLAISAGPAPVIVRGDITQPVRVLGILAAALLAGGKLWMLWGMLEWREARRLT